MRGVLEFWSRDISDGCSDWCLSEVYSESDTSEVSRVIIKFLPSRCLATKRKMSFFCLLCKSSSDYILCCSLHIGFVRICYSGAKPEAFPPETFFYCKIQHSFHPCDCSACLLHIYFPFSVSYQGAKPSSSTLVSLEMQTESRDFQQTAWWCFRHALMLIKVVVTYIRLCG